MACLALCEQGATLRPHPLLLVPIHSPSPAKAAVQWPARVLGAGTWPWVGQRSRGGCDMDMSLLPTSLTALLWLGDAHWTFWGQPGSNSSRVHPCPSKPRRGGIGTPQGIRDPCIPLSLPVPWVFGGHQEGGEVGKRCLLCPSWGGQQAGRARCPFAPQQWGVMQPGSRVWERQSKVHALLPCRVPAVGRGHPPLDYGGQGVFSWCEARAVHV